MEIRDNWRVVLGAMLGGAFGVASIYFYSSGLLLKPMSDEFGWSRAEASLGPLIVTLGVAALSPVYGRIIDLVGPLKVAMFSLIGLVIGFVLIGAFVHNLWSYIVCMAVLPALCAGSSGVSFTRIVVQAFDKQRGLALGISLIGSGLGAISIPILLTPILESYGWRGAYFSMATAVFVVLPLIWALLNKADADGKQTDKKLSAKSGVVSSIILNPVFWCLSILFLFAAGGVLGTIVHFVPMLTDQGLDMKSAAGIASLIGVAVIGGRVVTGFLLDRFNPSIVTASLFVLSAIGMALLYSGERWALVPGALITGIAVGAESDLIAFLIGRYFPISQYSATYGSIFSFYLIGGAFGSFVAGYSFDASGDYGVWLLTAMSSLILAALLSLILPSKPYLPKQKPNTPDGVML
tara:strand:- start:22649 stop:23872 length:1224 start_codon:yes stop_codon:yes gene_type:complete